MMHFRAGPLKIHHTTVTCRWTYGKAVLPAVRLGDDKAAAVYDSEACYFGTTESNDRR